MTPMSIGDSLDALALLRAYLMADQEAVRVLVENGDQAAMLSALVSLAAGMLLRGAEGDRAAILAYLDDLTAGIAAGGLS